VDGETAVAADRAIVAAVAVAAVTADRAIVAALAVAEATAVVAGAPITTGHPMPLHPADPVRIQAASATMPVAI